MAEPASVYRHAEEPIGTIRQVYDGQLFPDLQVNTFRNIDRLFATRTVKAGSAPFPLPAAERQLQNFHFESRGRTYDLYDFMALNRVAGLLVVKDGAVAFEQYALGNDAHTRWMSMSMVKSMAATLVGVAWNETYTDPASDRRAMLEAGCAGWAGNRRQRTLGNPA